VGPELRHLARVLVVVLTMSGALASVASAATTTIAEGVELRGGPRFAGSQTTWFESGKRQVAIRGRGSRGVPRTLLSQALSDHEDETGEFSESEATGYAASPSHVLLDVSARSGSRRYMQYVFEARVLARARDAATSTTIGSCSARYDAFTPPGVPVAGTGGGFSPAASALDGSIAVASGCPRATVRDLASGAVLRELPALGSDVRIAGRFVSWRAGAAGQPGEITVYDWQAGQEGYRIPLAPDSASAVYDLRADGSVATVQFAGPPGCDTGTLRWHSPDNPDGTPVLGAAPCARALAVDGDRAAIVTAGDTGAQVIADIGPDGTRRDLAWLGTGARRTGEVDYAAGRVAYALRGCDGRARILVAEDALQPEPTECARVTITRARRSGPRLRVAGTTDAGFRGRLRITYTRRAGRRTRSFTRTTQATGGAFSATVTLPRLARTPGGSPGLVTVRFPGDATYLPATATRAVRRGRS
jgi:hypothetical protein